VSVPRLLVLTDRDQATRQGRTLVEVVAAAVDAGAPAVVFREKDLDAGPRHELAARVADVVGAAGADLLVASDAGLADDVGAAGIHLAAGDPPVQRPGLLGRSCHDAAEVRAAVAGAYDYLTVSPVAPSPSKPGHGPPLGTDGLRRLAAEAGRVPVLALGGIDPELAAGAVDAGAHGVAVMGAVMSATDPGAVVRRLLARLPEGTP
jgi:thiamine-phosphate pyrophosphorylase